jgi:hypothetical protein
LGDAVPAGFDDVGGDADDGDESPRANTAFKPEPAAVDFDDLDDTMSAGGA